MKLIKTVISLLLVMSLLCGCAANAPIDEGEKSELSDVLPDYDTDENETGIVAPEEFEDDGGALPDTPINQNPNIVHSSNDEFLLTLCNAKEDYTSDENIEIEASVSLLAGEELTVWSGDPILTFSLEGDTCFNDYQGSGMTMDVLMPNTFTNIEDYITPYSKSGGYSANDPYVDFYKDFFADRDSIKLPAGNYTVTAYLSYSMDADDVIGTRRSLSATVRFTVSGKTLKDLGYYPKDPEAQPTEEEIITEPEVAPDVEEPVSNEGSLNVQPLANVTYPEMTQYPDESNITDWLEYEMQYSCWQVDRRTQRSFPGRGEGVDSYVFASVKEILHSDKNENLVYSPMNVYMALGMLAELTDGNSRAQILEVLGEDSIEKLRESATAVWNNNYCNDGALTSIMAGSVWADESIDLKESTAKALADSYYSEIYSCDVGSKEMLDAYKAWLNKQTGGLLKDAIENTQIDPETVLALATTVYFRAKWESEFMERFNTTRVFNSPDGATECEFMHSSGSGAYFYSDNFAAVQKRFNDGGAMWFVLPDEDVSLDELVNDDKALDLIINDGGACEYKHVVINLSVPKFDVKSDIDLNTSLSNLGIKDVFNASKADFSNLSSSADTDVFLNNVKHAARVAVDEEGVTAAAYTEMMLAGAAMPPDEEVDFVLDRPFLFAITGYTGDVLFVGIVNNPIA